MFPNIFINYFPLDSEHDREALYLYSMKESRTHALLIKTITNHGRYELRFDNASS